MKYLPFALLFGGLLFSGCSSPRPDLPPTETALTAGVLTNDTPQALKWQLPAPLQPNRRVTFALKLSARHAITVATGRGQERFTLRRTPEELLDWNCFSPDGRRQAKDWGRNFHYAPNGILQDRFDFPEFLQQWNHFYAAKFYRDVTTTFFDLTLETDHKYLRWYLDDILIGEYPATPDLFTCRPILTLPPGTAAKVTQHTLKPTAPQFLPVNIARKINAANSSLKLPGTPGQRIVFHNIPFELPARAGQVDVGEAWVREANLFSYEQSRRGTFGGRWRGALSGNPTRLQFRVPNRHYQALYLLASCPKRPDRVPQVTAQFFRTCSGFPKNFTPVAPIKTDGQLQVIRIPIAMGQLAEFRDLNPLEVELSGQVHIYRAAPDPHHYSLHTGGLPSGVQVYAMTLETAEVEVALQGEAKYNVWTECAPGFQVKVTNHRDQTQTCPLKFKSCSFDGQEKHELVQQLIVPPHQEVTTRFDLPLKKYGFHRVVLTAGEQQYEQTLVRLRRRELRARKFAARGFMFGAWNWDGDHFTLPVSESLDIVGPLGMESFHNYASGLLDRTTARIAQQYGMKTFWYQYFGFRARNLQSPENIRQHLQNMNVPATHLNEPIYTYIFAEPGGLDTHGTLPEFYGEYPLPQTPAVKKAFQTFKRQIIAASQALRKQYPKCKILMPWGDPVFAVPFLQDPDTRHRFDGVAVDIGYFDRLPEQQLHQCSIHRMYQLQEMWRRYRQDKPQFITIEGPCLGVIAPGSLTPTEHAAHTLRCALLLGAYGVNRQFAIAAPHATASYWGEQHYGGGMMTRNSQIMPYPTYAALGTLIRHLRHMEFRRWVPTGSLSVYALEFQDARNGQKLHVLWTIRGQRPVKMKFRRIYDSMDNLVSRPVLGQLPIFVYGSDSKIELGTPNHADQPALPVIHKLGNSAELFVRQSQDSDDEYLNSFPLAIRRFPASMQLKRTISGLAITLPPQKINRLTMPYYTTLHPQQPIEIPGQAQYLTMDITAHSDWGRIVYVLRDAKGEKWISVGQKENWNCDDTPNASYFNFDGTRRVRFELPGNLAWDNFRTKGSCWWGAYGGDRIVDLPLKIEKIFVERRAQALYVNSLEKCSTLPVVLGNLYAEYPDETARNTTKRSRRPAPDQQIKMRNIIAELHKTGELPPSYLTAVTEPEHYYDGTRGIFHFKTMPHAVSYDIYLSLRPDGAGAIKLGKNLKKSGTLVRGFQANTVFYAFVVYCDRQGRHSRPSPPYKFSLKDNFGNK